MIILIVHLPVKTRVENDYLLKDIENLRQLMIKVAFEEGFTSINTIKLSRRLDLLLSKLETANQR